jgi:predicted Zn-dependent protease
VGSRSAAEYGLTANGASGGESPSALNMAAGSLPRLILKQLGTGLYISNLWYLNYSDQPAARLTGMTRFATFWVENGEIRRRSAPCVSTTAPTACWVRSWKH